MPIRVVGADTVNARTTTERDAEMSSTEFDTRMKKLEGRLDKAEGLLESAGRLFGTVERSHDRIHGGSRAPLVVVAASALAAVTGVFVARRLQAT
jgi:hypothetical protein